MSKMKEASAKLESWQNRLAQSNTAYSAEVNKMEERERLYNGDREMRPLVPGDTKRDGGVKKTSHVRNVIFENIESQISVAVPQPKVTPRRKKDEKLAEIIENFLRNELDRLPFEVMNDMAERTVPIQGGVGFMVEWDNTKATHMTVGEVDVGVVHPKQLAPQPGVFTGVEDMDWVIVKVPTTKEAIRRKFGVDVHMESEAEPEIRGTEASEVTDDAITQYIGYEKNDNGGINRYSWVNEIELEDLTNYQARRQPVCKGCGRVRPLPGQIINNAVDDTMGDLLPDPASGFAGGLIPQEADRTERAIAGKMLARQMAGEESGEDERGALRGVEVKAGKEPDLKANLYEGGACPWCGGEDFDSREQDFEQVMLPVQTAGGVRIEGAHPALDDEGRPVMQPTLIPFYKPDMYPIILQRSVSVHGQLLGNSDVDQIRDQQNTINRTEQKIIDRLMKAGTRITLPDRADLRTDTEDSERWYIASPADKAMIDVYEFTGDLQFELMYLANVYEEARQIIGITDSFQGRKDSTATSGKAKEFAAAQTAGRLDSKRAMKDAAYSALFELMFKFWLAYSDEPRPVVYKNYKGDNEYLEFNRYDFLEQDEGGGWYWNDQFMFSCDSSAPLANNREAMWQETRMNLQTGAFGDPASPETLILFWSKMEELHYPGAGGTKQFLEERMERERQMQEQQMMQQQAAQAQAAQRPPGAGGDQGIPPELLQGVEQRAMADAMRDAGGQTPR